PPFAMLAQKDRRHAGLRSRSGGSGRAYGRAPARMRGRAMRRARFSLAVAACLASAGPAWAAGSVDTVASSAAGALGATPGASVVVAAPLVSDQPAPRGDDLALRVAALVAGRIGAGAHAHPQTANLAAARALAGRASALVYVQSEIARGDLRTTID